MNRKESIVVLTQARKKCKFSCKDRKRQSGFILIEVLVGLLLTALLMQALFPLLSMALLSWKASVARMEVHQAARMSTEAMMREIRFASAIFWPPLNQADSRIQFQKRDSAGALETLTFQQGSPSGLNQHTLYRIHYPGTPNPLTQNIVSELRFRHLPPRLIQISMTVTDTATQVSHTLETSIHCANLPD